MFEQPVEREEKDRSRAIMLLSGAALVIVIGLIVLVSSLSNDIQPHEELARPGSPEFDSYAPSVQILESQTFTGLRLNVPYGRINCKVKNAGDRTLVGLELKGIAIGWNSEVIREQVVTIIPDRRDSFPPGVVIGNVDINLEPVPEGSAMQIRAEVTGLKLE